MKRKNNAGFSLVEVLVAIAVLAAIVIPVCSSMVLSVRVNAKAEAVLQARVAVSSAVETLMAKGIPWNYQGEDLLGEKFAKLHVKIERITETESQADGESNEEAAEKATWFAVTVSDAAEDPLVTITTKVRAVEPQANGEGGTQ